LKGALAWVSARNFCQSQSCSETSFTTIALAFEKVKEHLRPDGGGEGEGWRERESSLSAECGMRGAELALLASCAAAGFASCVYWRLAASVGKLSTILITSSANLLVSPLQIFVPHTVYLLMIHIP